MILFPIGLVSGTLGVRGVVVSGVAIVAGALARALVTILGWVVAG